MDRSKSIISDTQCRYRASNRLLSQYSMPNSVLAVLRKRINYVIGVVFVLAAAVIALLA
jgi:hypothetical protein